VIDRREAERAIIGAWRLFLNRPEAVQFFDTGVDGFWRSFQAIVLVAPLYAVTALADRVAVIHSLPPGTFSDGVFWSAKVVGLCLDWVAFPILLAALAGFIGIGRGYVPYIAIRNWATVLMTIPFSAIAVLQMLGIGDDLLLLPSLVALAFSLRLNYVIARRTLGVPADVAGGLVALDWLVSIAIVLVVDQVTGYPLTS
jgi:hypothetical protein